MGLLDFFKTILNKNSIEDIEEEIINFSDVKNWIKNKHELLENEEKVVLNSINKQIIILNEELDKKLKILKNVDIDSKKVDAKSKLIVKGNSKNYINSVNQLINKLNSLDFISLNSCVDDINKYFEDFFKKSDASYQKTTFLIGKEILAVKETLVNFYKKQKQIINDNEHIILTKQTISAIQIKLDSIDEIKKSIKEISNKIKLLNKKTKKLKEKKINYNSEINQIKKSKDYSERLERKKEIDILKSNLKNEYENLKQLIDFKALANEFHNSANEMEIIKSYKDYFETAVKKDEYKNLIRLLKEAKLFNDSIKSKIIEMKTQKEELGKKELSLGKDKIPDLLKEIKKIENDLEIFKMEKNQESLINEKFLNNEKDLTKQIKGEFLKIKVVVEK